jgi:large-conductance mechanosensitive channel
MASLTRLVGFILGGTDLGAQQWQIVKATPESARSLTVSWGMIISAIITLLATAFVVYQIVHVAKLDKLDKKAE